MAEAVEVVRVFLTLFDMFVDGASEGFDLISDSLAHLAMVCGTVGTLLGVLATLVAWGLSSGGARLTLRQRLIFRVAFILFVMSIAPALLTPMH